MTIAGAYGIQTQAKEALAFAVLAAATLRGRPNTVPSCTGARRAVVMGKIVPGDNFPALLRRLARAGREGGVASSRLAGAPAGW